MVTYRSSVVKIDKLLARRMCDRGLSKDYKVIQNENLTTQHKLVVMDLDIKWKKKKKRAIYNQTRIK